MVQVFELVVHAFQPPVSPEQLKVRLRWINPTWPEGQLRLSLCGVGQVVQVLDVVVHAFQEPSPEQVNVRFCWMDPTWPAGQVSDWF